MKIISIGKEWTVFDGERILNVESGEVAFGYAMLMAQVRDHESILPSIYPVRSLVPHPKKIELTKAQKEKISKIKSGLSAKII